MVVGGGSGTGDGQFNRPNGVAVDSLGNVYVADSYNQRIQKFTGSGAFITKWGITGGPIQVAIDTSGNVYVTLGNYEVQKFTSAGMSLAKWGSIGTRIGETFQR